MGLNLGVHVYEKATAVSTPVLADVSIPFVVGAAPAHSASDPAKANVPVLATNWDEAVAQLGFSYDWKKYPLCEFMYSHFQLYGCQPVVFCNVLDSSRASMKDSEAGDGQTAVPVVEHQASIPFDAIASTIQVSADADFGTVLELDTDYSILYDEDTDTCLVELLDGGESYDATELYIKYGIVKPETFRSFSRQSYGNHGFIFRKMHVNHGRAVFPVKIFTKLHSLCILFLYLRRIFHRSLYFVEVLQNNGIRLTFSRMLFHFLQRHAVIRLRRFQISHQILRLGHGRKSAAIVKIFFFVHIKNGKGFF